MLLPVPSLPLIPLATSPYPYREVFPYVTVRLSGSCCLRPPPIFCHLPTSATGHRTPAARSTPPTRGKCGEGGALLYSQPSPAPGSPRTVSPVVRAELGAVCCVPALESQIKGQRPRPEPGGRRWAPGAQPPPPACSFSPGVMQAQTAGGVTPRRIPGLPAVTGQSENRRLREPRLRNGAVLQSLPTSPKRKLRSDSCKRVG